MSLAPKLCVWFCLLAVLWGTGWAETQSTNTSLQILEGEDYPGDLATVYQDVHASGEHTAIVKDLQPVAALYNRAHATVFTAEPDLAAGCYRIQAKIGAHPIDRLHQLRLEFVVGGQTRFLNPAWFEPTTPYTTATVYHRHTGGPLSIEIVALGHSDEAKRAGTSSDEAAMHEEMADGAAERAMASVAQSDKDEGLSLDEALPMTALKPWDFYAACDHVTIEHLPTPAMVSEIRCDKIHYRPGDEIRVEVRLAPNDHAPLQLVVYELRGRQRVTQLHTKQVQLNGEQQTVAFTYKADDEPFGRQLVAVLLPPNKHVEVSVVDLANAELRLPGSASCVFGVSQNVYQIGIEGHIEGIAFHMDLMTEARAESIMAKNADAYANYVEMFGWAPCSFSNFTPKTEVFYAGQTQYRGTLTGYRNMIRSAHRRGIKMISYASSLLEGIAGFETFRRRPELFQTNKSYGLRTGRIGLFNLERMWDGDYEGVGDFQNCYITCQMPETVALGAEAFIEGVRLLGWDGIRWDSHIWDAQRPFVEKVNAAFPQMVHGYNGALANFGGQRPWIWTSGAKDLADCAAGGGMIMDESARNWGNPRLNAGTIEPFYKALAESADYFKRLDGLPLIIQFDDASNLDRVYNLVSGLAAGQRHTRTPVPIDFAYGRLEKWLTRFSAYVWDNTQRVARPQQHIQVKTSPAQRLWWQDSCWLRRRSAQHQQLLVNIVNPPGYESFGSRVEPPAPAVKNLAVIYTLPATIRVTGASFLSPELQAGQQTLSLKNTSSQGQVLIPRLKTWGILVLDLQPADNQPFGEPALEPTQPIVKMDMFLNSRKAEAARKAAQEAAEQLKIARIDKEDAPIKEADAQVNIAMLKAQAGRPDQPTLYRDGVFNIHHCRGLFSWLNNVPEAAAIALAVVEPSWLEQTGMKPSPRVLDGFPNDYAELFAADCVVLDNIHAAALGPMRRHMLAEFVTAGGGLLILGGHFNLSCGSDADSILAELLPVTVESYRHWARDDEAGYRIAPTAAAAFPEDIDWQTTPSAFTVDLSPVKADAKVLLKAGPHPAIVTRRHGEGRVTTVLINVHGNPADSLQPYWRWRHWPRVLATCLRQLGRGHEKQSNVAQALEARPDFDLAGFVMDAYDMTSTELNKQLVSAATSVIDSDSGLALVECMLENVNRITDETAVDAVMAAVLPHVDPSFDGVADRMLERSIPSLLCGAFAIIQRRNDQGKVDRLLAGLGHRDARVRRTALVALGAVATPQAITALMAYQSEDVEERLIALNAALPHHLPATRLFLPTYAAAYHKWRVTRSKLEAERQAAAAFGFTLSRKAQRQAALERERLAKTIDLLRTELALSQSLMTQLTDDSQVTQLVAGMIVAEERLLIPLIRGYLCGLPNGQFQKIAAKLSEARLPEIRRLAASANTQ